MWELHIKSNMILDKLFSPTIVLGRTNRVSKHGSNDPAYTLNINTFEKTILNPNRTNLLLYRTHIIYIS